MNRRIGTVSVSYGPEVPADAPWLFRKTLGFAYWFRDNGLCDTRSALRVRLCEAFMNLLSLPLSILFACLVAVWGELRATFICLLMLVPSRFICAVAVWPHNTRAKLNKWLREKESSK